MFHYRINKYKESNEWTSISDFFDSISLLDNEYIPTELLVVEEIMYQASQLSSHWKIGYVFDGRFNLTYEDYGIDYINECFISGQRCDFKLMEKLSVLSLREIVGVEFISDAGDKIYFGDEYYVHIESLKKLTVYSKELKLEEVD